MRFLGIDYGTKRIGLAISDEGSTLSFPKEILENDKNLLEKIGEVIEEEKVEEIVIGESLNFSGGENKVMQEVKVFIKELEEKFKIKVHMEKEFLTSVEARRYNEEGKKVDASAAALILQRFLDKNNKVK